MMKNLIKNIEFKKPIELKSLVGYNEGQIVSRTLSQGKTVSITLFSFDKGEEISTHASGGDAMVYILDGMAEITIGDEKFTVKGRNNYRPPETFPCFICRSVPSALTVVFSLE